MAPIYDAFLGALQSVGTAATITSAGAYLYYRGYLTAENKGAFARFSQQVALPLFFFTRSIRCPHSSQGEVCPNFTNYLGHAWILLVWPFYVVGSGLVVGYLCGKLFRVKCSSEKPLVLAAVAFYNATALPITLLSVAEPFLAQRNIHAGVDTSVLLSIYMIFYPVLQWSLGQWLIQKDETSKHLHDEEEAASLKTTDYDDLNSNSDAMALVEPIKSTSSNNHMISTNTSVALTAVYLISDIMYHGIQAPVIGTVSGVLISMIKPARQLFVNTDVINGAAPLGWLFQGLDSIGKSAVPVAMSVLGVNLTLSLTRKQDIVISKQSCVAIVVGKMIIMPVVGITTVYLLKRVWTLPEELQVPLLLVLMVQFLSPTSTTLMIMAEISGSQMKEQMSRIIALQYLFAPLLLTLSFMAVLQVAIM